MRSPSPTGICQVNIDNQNTRIVEYLGMPDGDEAASNTEPEPEPETVTGECALCSQDLGESEGVR
jgi:hypothetical protein